MAVSVGDKIPDVEVHTLGADGGPAGASAAELLGTGRVVIFGVPGAFTPICSATHLPGYVAGAEALAGKGVDRIACISVNDVWTMDAWAKSAGAGDEILMIADGNLAFTRAMGLEFDLSVAGLGLRSKRYAAVIEDGVITKLEVEPDANVSTSSCANVLASL